MIFNLVGNNKLEVSDFLMEQYKQKIMCGDYDLRSLVVTLKRQFSECKSIEQIFNDYTNDEIKAAVRKDILEEISLHL